MPGCASVTVTGAWIAVPAGGVMFVLVPPTPPEVGPAGPVRAACRPWRRLAPCRARVALRARRPRDARAARVAPVAPGRRPSRPRPRVALRPRRARRAEHRRPVELVADRLRELGLGHRAGLELGRADAVARQLRRRVGRPAERDEQREQADVVAAQVGEHLDERRLSRRMRQRRSTSIRCATERSCGVVTLKFAGEDSTTRTVPPARSTSQASSVAQRQDRRIDGQRGLERLAPERLRRLDRPQPRAVVRGDHDAGLVGLLDRVDHARGGDRAVRVLELGDDAREQLRRRPAGAPRRARRRAGARRGVQRRAHGLRARRTAAHADAPVRRDAVRRQRDHDLRDPGRAQRVQRPLEHRPAGQLDEGLRDARHRAASHCPRPREVRRAPTHPWSCRGRMRQSNVAPAAASCSAVRRRISSR